MAMLNIPSTNTDPSYRYKMPRLVSKTEGRGNGIKTAVMNCKEVATAIHRPPGYIMKWFGCELGTKSDFTDKEGEGARAIVMGQHQTSVLQESLDKFLSVYVLCPTCGLPEMDLKTQKKSEEISGTCKACGFAGMLQDATTHRMAAYVLKNPIDGGGDDKGAKKLSKEERRAKKNMAARGGGKEEDDEDAGGKKKKKKNKAAEEEDESGGDDDKKKKKKKKDKKEKKKKGTSSKDADTDGEGGDDVSGGGGVSSTKMTGSSEDDEPISHKDELITDIILSLAELKDGPADVFVEDARNKQISAGVDKKMLMYMAVEAIFGDIAAIKDGAAATTTQEGEDEEDGADGDSGKGDDDSSAENKNNKTSKNITLTAKCAEKYKDILVGLIKGEKINVTDMMWGFELFVSEYLETTNCLKTFPMVCKALYDMELIDNDNFIPHFKDSKANKSNPGHSAVHKAIKPFAEWLEDSSSESDSD